MTNCSPNDLGAGVVAQLAKVYSAPVEASKQRFHPSRIKGIKTFPGLAMEAEGGNKHESLVHNKARNRRARPPEGREKYEF